MTDSFVTQCPHCRTSFRVSRAQLGAAHGAVRCGACMQVFNAAQHLLSEVAPSTPAATAARPSAATPPPAVTPSPDKPAAASPITPAVTPPAARPAATTMAPAAPASAPAAQAAKKISDDTLWIHDDLDLDALNLDEELARLEEEEQQLSRDFLAVERAPKRQEQLLGQLSAQRDVHDESWAERLLETPKASPTAPLAPRSAAQEPVATPPSARETRIEPAISPLISQPEQHENEDDDGLHPDFRRHEGDNSLRLSADVDQDEASEPEEHQPEPEPSLSALPPRARIEEIDLGGALRTEPVMRNESLLNLSEEPLQLDWQQQKKPWGRWIAWSLLNLIGASALAGQYVSYHFDELARQDQYRPWFEQLCPEIGCKLPSKVDVAQIKSSNLVVRSHPEFNGALVVDAILYNRASFSQPFPLLELRFADMSGQLLASRRFKPGEYLGGELAGQTEMPPQTPIRISLDILDPGAKAVNYSLSFFSPE